MHINCKAQGCGASQFRIRQEDRAIECASCGEFVNMNEHFPNVFTMPFGKHKGKTLEQCPVEYLEWLVQNFDDGKAKAAAQEYLSKLQ